MNALTLPGLVFPVSLNPPIKSFNKFLGFFAIGFTSCDIWILTGKGKTVAPGFSPLAGFLENRIGKNEKLLIQPVQNVE